MNVVCIFVSTLLRNVEHSTGENLFPSDCVSSKVTSVGFWRRSSESIPNVWWETNSAFAEPDEREIKQTIRQRGLNLLVRWNISKSGSNKLSFSWLVFPQPFFNFGKISLIFQCVIAVFFNKLSAGVGCSEAAVVCYFRELQFLSS